MDIKELFEGVGQGATCKRIVIRTQEPIAFCDITEIVGTFVEASEITTGIALVRTRHTTTGLTCTEADPALHHDIIDMLERLVPRDDVAYRHSYEGENNARAHLRSVLVGSSTWAPIRRGQLNLGTWQRLYLVEFWASMEREIDVAITSVGE